LRIEGKYLPHGRMSLEQRGGCLGMKTLSFIARAAIGMALFGAIVNPHLTIYLHLNASPQ
jgi:hypothetical protein